MYVRFVSPRIDPYTGAELGFMQTHRYITRSETPKWVLSELRLQFDWYNRHLCVPEKLGRHFKRRNSIWGICWFKPEAKECLERAHYCAWLFREASCPIRMIKADIRKEIIWQDENQILCKATKDVPRAFH